MNTQAPKTALPDNILNMSTNAAFFHYVSLMGWTYAEAAKHVDVSIHTINSWARPVDNNAHRTTPRRCVLLIGLLHVTKDAPVRPFPHSEY